MPSWTQDIDATTPAATDLVSQGDDQLRNLKTALLERMNSIFTDFNADPLVFNLRGLGISLTINAGGPTQGQAGYDILSLWLDVTNKKAYLNQGTTLSTNWFMIVTAQE